MPFDFVIDMKHRIVCSRAWGEFTEADVVAHRKHLKANPQIDPTFRQLADFSGVTGWFVVRQRGSNIRLQNTTPTETLRIILPAPRPIKRSTPSHILKQANLSVEEWNEFP